MTRDKCVYAAGPMRGDGASRLQDMASDLRSPMKGWLKRHRPAAVLPAVASGAMIFLITVFRIYEEFRG